MRILIDKCLNWRLGRALTRQVDLGERYFWRNMLGDFDAMAWRHRPPPVAGK